MASKVFAPRVDRDENGWLRFPSDANIRDALWPPEVTEHPAKYNCFMLSALVEYMTKPGDTILDPMSGTGTTMLAATLGRNVICIELEEGYHQMQQYVLRKIRDMDTESANRITLLHGDCRKFLPLPCDAVIFSPPYTNILKVRQSSDFAQTTAPNLEKYSESPWNIGNYNYFMYLQVMEKVYANLALSAKNMVVVIKDHIEDQQRVTLVDDSIRMAGRGGWKVVERHKMYMAGSSFTKLYRSRGMETVDDEDIIILESKRGDWLSRNKR
mgnify:FL=1